MESDLGMEKQKCECRSPDLYVAVIATCKAKYSGERITVDITGVDYRSSLFCANCQGQVVLDDVRDCPFLVMRDIVSQVCTSCVKQDGRVRFATQHNFCNRPPITQGPAFEKMD